LAVTSSVPPAPLAVTVAALPTDAVVVALTILTAKLRPRRAASVASALAVDVVVFDASMVTPPDVDVTLEESPAPLPTIVVALLVRFEIAPAASAGSVLEPE
jgi:hypothetical protein